MLESIYKPFRIRSKDYFIRYPLGSEGYLAGAFLASTNEPAEEKVVIKILHPHIFAALLGKHSAEQGSPDKLVSDFVREAIILNELEKNGIGEGVMLRGVSIGLKNLELIDEMREDIEVLCLNYPAAAYTEFPLFLIDFFSGSDKDHKLLVESLEASKSLLENPNIGLPFLALEYVGDGYDDLDNLLDKGKLTLQSKLLIAQHFAHLLSKIHSIGIAYQDFKENHIFWYDEKMKIKVIDWNEASQKATNEQKQKDLREFGKLLYELFVGRKYIGKGISADVRIDEDVPGTTFMIMSGGEHVTLDFGESGWRLPFVLRLLIEELISASEKGRYRNTEVLLDDLKNPGLIEWLSTNPIEPDFLKQAGRKADAKRSLAQKAFIAADYESARNLLLESLFYSPSLVALALFLELIFLQRGEIAPLTICKNVRELLENDEYKLALSQLDNNDYPEFRALYQIVNDLETLLKSADDHLNAGNFLEAKDSYLHALTIDYQCKKARNGWYSSNEIAGLFQSADEALRKNQFEQATIILDELKGRLPSNSATDSFERKIKYGRHYQRALINEKNERFDIAIEELQQALHFQSTLEAQELFQKISRAGSLQASLQKQLDDDNYEEARNEVDQLLKLYPESQSFQAVAQRVLVGRNEYNTAKESLEDAAKLVRGWKLEDARHRLNQARQRIASSNFTSPSILLFREQIDLQITQIDRVSRLQQALNGALANGEFAMALDVIDEISTIGLEIEVANIRQKISELKSRVDQVHVARENGRYDEALRELENIEESTPATNFLQRLKDLILSEKDVREEAGSRLEEGRSLAQSGEWERALISYQSAVEVISKIDLVEKQELKRLNTNIDINIRWANDALEAYRAAEHAFESGDLADALAKLNSIPEKLTTSPRVEKLRLVFRNAKDEINSLKGTVLDLKAAFTAGDLDAASKSIAKLPGNLAWKYSKQFYEEQGVAKLRAVISDVKIHLEAAQSAFERGNLELSNFELDQAADFWPECRDIKAMRSRFHEQDALAKEAVRIRNEIQQQVANSEYEHALELLLRLLERNPSDNQLQVEISDIREEAKLYQYGVKEFRKIRKQSQIDDEMILKLDQLKRRLSPLESKADQNRVRVKELFKAIDDLLYQHGLKLTEALSLDLLKANRGKKYKHALEIINRLSQITGITQVKPSSEIIAVASNLTDRAKAISVAREHLISFELLESKNALSSLDVDDDSETQSLSIQLERLLAFEHAILSKDFDLALATYQSLRKEYSSDPIIKSLDEIAQACIALLQPGGAKLAEQAYKVRSDFSQLIATRPTRIANYMNALLEAIEQQVRVEEHIENLIQSEQYDEAQKLLLDPTIPNKRIFLLQTKINNALSTKISSLKVAARAAQERKDYGTAYGLYSDVLRYANETEREVIEGQLRELDSLRTREILEKTQIAEDKLKTAQDVYRKLQLWWKLDLVEGFNKNKEIPVLDVARNMLYTINQLLREALNLNPNNSAISKLQGEVAQFESKLNTMSDIFVVIDSISYIKAWSIAAPLGERPLIINLIVSRRIKEKIFGIKKSVRELIERGKSLIGISHIAANQSIHNSHDLSEGVDRDLVKQTSESAGIPRPKINLIGITAIVVILVLIGLAVRTPALKFLQSPMAVPTEEPTGTPTYTFTPKIPTNSPTTIPSETPTPFQPLVIGLPRVIGIRIYNDQTLSVVAFTLGKDERIVLCGYDQVLDRYSLVRESIATCNETVYWANAVDIKIGEVLSPQIGIAKTQLAIWDPKNPGNSLEGQFLFDKIPVLICKVSNTGTTLLFSYNNCSDPTGWVAETYMRTLVEVPGSQVPDTPTIIPPP
ncbi:MAG: hypothetical protein HS100_04505 [Anaerolineales bacterium]|nr:hypothetical protein [Anaerolineales bacterium]